jgi:hypothetical protein
MKQKNIIVMIFIALISPLAAFAVDCGGSGCKVCETTTCSGTINMGDGGKNTHGNATGTITCSNGYKVTASGTDLPCYKDDVLQYKIQYASLRSGLGGVDFFGHIDSAAAVAFIRMCTGM